MAAPKSVVKIKKNGVEYTSSVDRCEYFIFELCRAGLRDVGRFLKKRFRENYYKHFGRHTGRAGRVTKYTVYSSKNTQFPRISIGLRHATKGKVVPGFYGYFQETGTSKQPKLGILTETAQSNIAQIVEIESQYLSALEDEARALRLIDEREYTSEEDGDA